MGQVMLPEGMRHLRAERVWLTWVVMSRTRKDGVVTPPTKVPHTLRGKWWKSNTPGADGLGTFDDALDAAEAMRASCKPGTVVGIGFSVRHAGLATLDLDACVRDDGVLLPWAEDVLRRARALGAYIERTPSGTGMRVIGTAPMSGYHPCKRVWRADGDGVGDKRPGIEVFNLVSGFNTFSGTDSEGDARADISALVDEIIDRVPLSRAAKERHEATKVLALPNVMPVERMRALLDALPCTLVVPRGDNDAAMRVYSWLAFLAGVQWTEARDVVRAWGLTYDGDDGWLDDVLGNIDRDGVKVTHPKPIIEWLRGIADDDDVALGDNARATARDNAEWLEGQRAGARLIDGDGLEQIAPEDAGVAPPNPVMERMQANAASRIAEELHERLKWIEEAGRFAVRDGVRWRIASEADVYALVMPVVREIAAAQDTAARREKVLSVSWYEAVLRAVRRNSRVAVPFDRWDADPWLLMTPGGVVVDLRDGTTRAATPEDMMLKAAGADPVPISAWRERGPRWARFLDEAFEDVSVRRYVQKVAGVALIGKVLAQNLFVFTGDGGNGKTTLLEALVFAMGEYAAPVSSKLVLTSGGGEHASIKADLKGLRLAVMSEVGEDSRLSVVETKSLTGGERIKARFMRQDWFWFDPSHTLVLAANRVPTFSGDGGMERRLVVIEMLRKPARPDPHLPDTLRMEAGAILAWAIEGAVLFGAEGLDAPEAVAAASAEVSEGTDPVKAWFRQRVVVTGEPEDEAATADMVEALREWSMEDRADRHLRAVTDRALALRLKAVAMSDQRVRVTKHAGRGENSDGRMGYVGLRLREKERGV